MDYNTVVLPRTLPIATVARLLLAPCSPIDHIMSASAYALMGGALSPLILWLVQFRLVSENWTGILEWPKLL